MIWNTENQNGNKCYTSTVGPFIFTISESEGCFILSIEIIINDRPHDYRKDICESLGKAKGAAEWHLWELRDDAKSFLTTADAALRGGGSSSDLPPTGGIPSI